MDTSKKFRCKQEELVVICEYVHTCFLRDLPDFNAFASTLDSTYLIGFKAKIEAMRGIVFPQDKTKELKTVTARLYAGMDALADILDRINGYLLLAKGSDVPTAADFGTIILKRKIHSRDAEGILKNLQQVIANTEKFSQQLAAQGWQPEMLEQLHACFTQISADNQNQYELTSARRLLSAENRNALAALYAQLMEICNIGKMLYKKSQPAKLPDYTFVALLKKVRTVTKKAGEA
jgi:hypothetical protein